MKLLGVIFLQIDRNQQIGPGIFIFSAATPRGLMHSALWKGPFLKWNLNRTPQCWCVVLLSITRVVAERELTEKQIKIGLAALLLTHFVFF